MPKRKPQARSAAKNRRKTPAKKRRGLGTILLFWPLLVFHKLTAPLPTGLRWAARLIGHPGLLSLYFLIPVALVYHARARNFDMGLVAEMPERTIVLDRRGKELGRIHGEKRDIVRKDQIATTFLQAILAREDERFYNHWGVDWIGFGRAAIRNLSDRELTQGASTLTMQLARNSFDLRLPWLSFSDTLQELDRKFLEIAVAHRIEAHHTKDEILEHYINRIFWGHTIRGIEEASRTYFEKPARDLTLSESALLAGIVRGPNAFSPFRDLTDAIRERDTTLDRMVKAGLIDEQEAAAAKAEEIEIRPEWRRVFHDSWAMDAVRRELERILEEEDIEMGGLQITTTIDDLVQAKAEEALDRHLRSFERSSGYRHQTRLAWQALPEPRPNPQYLQGAVVVIENLTGAIIATVGGRDADESKYNRAVQAERQLGSTFKPFIYLAAFEKGLRPDSLISDDPLRRGEIPGAGNWSPRNSDGEYHGMKPVRYGLVRSRNTMSIRVGDYAGIERVADTAEQVGFTQPMTTNPASLLGTLEASPVELASAFTVFPNGGERFPPRVIAEIRDRYGEVQYRNPQLSYYAARSDAAHITAEILGEAVDRGTGAGVRRLGFAKPAGGKTGTTNDFKDAWFAGFTSSLTCAVWVGLDQPATIIPRGYGSVLALPVWTEVMKTADRLGYEAEGLKSKRYFTECRLCRTTGKRATEGCESAGTAFTESLPVDELPGADAFCSQHRGEPSEPGGRPPKATPVTDAPPAARALPVDEADDAGTPAPDPAPRAEPVEEPVPRAERVEDPEVPRALPVD
jgi:penicillin-binding protein 1A